MDLDTLGTVAIGATVLAVGIGVTMSVAIAGAMWEAVSPGSPTRVCVTSLWVLRDALVLFGLVMSAPVWWPPLMLWRLAVTYVHVYPSDRESGRHFRGYGNRLQPAGHHRVMA